MRREHKVPSVKRHNNHEVTQPAWRTHDAQDTQPRAGASHRQMGYHNDMTPDNFDLLQQKARMHHLRMTGTNTTDTPHANSPRCGTKGTPHLPRAMPETISPAEMRPAPRPAMDLQARTHGPIMVQQINDPNAKPPVCKYYLKSTGEEELVRFRIALVDFDHDVARHKQQYNVHYEPRLSEWVSNSAWLRISEDLLVPEDATFGGPPNDKAVEDFLRLRGTYATNDPNKATRCNPPLCIVPPCPR